MGKSNAQRQREFRARHGGAGDDDAEMLERLNMMVSVNARRQLQRLASCYGVTQRAMLERVITRAASDLLDSLDGQQQADFYGMNLALRSNDAEGDH